MNAEITFNETAASHACGMPQERLARMAARRAFVEMKACFLQAAAEIEGASGALLLHKVRATSEVIELWRLRSAIFAALPRNNARADAHRLVLTQQIELAFPEDGGETSFAPL